MCGWGGGCVTVRKQSLLRKGVLKKVGGCMGGVVGVCVCGGGGVGGWVWVGWRVCDREEAESAEEGSAQEGVCVGGWCGWGGGCVCGGGGVCSGGCLYCKAGHPL